MTLPTPPTPTVTTVCTCIVWYDLVTENDVAATIDLGAPVLAGAQGPSDLSGISSFEMPGITYDYSRAWEPNDGFGVVGNTLSVTPNAVTGNADMLRVFTQCG